MMNRKEFRFKASACPQYGPDYNDDIEAFLMIAINLLSKEDNHAST